MFQGCSLPFHLSHSCTDLLLCIHRLSHPRKHTTQKPDAHFYLNHPLRHRWTITTISRIYLHVSLIIIGCSEAIALTAIIVEVVAQGQGGLVCIRSSVSTIGYNLNHNSGSNSHLYTHLHIYCQQCKALLQCTCSYKSLL